MLFRKSIVALALCAAPAFGESSLRPSRALSEAVKADGNIDDWDLNADFVRDMYNEDNKLAAKAYAKWDCATQTLCVAVLGEMGNSIDEEANKAWVKDYALNVKGGSSHKYVPDQFAFVQAACGHAVGFETCFGYNEAGLRDQLEIHVSYNEGSHTASTGLKMSGDMLSLDLTCPEGSTTACGLDGVCSTTDTSFDLKRRKLQTEPCIANPDKNSKAFKHWTGKKALKPGCDPSAICANTGYGTDKGCDAEAPACVKKDDFEPAEGDSGVRCARCVNDMFDGSPDSGCSGDSPLCVAPNGNNVEPGFAGAYCKPCDTIKPDISVCFNIDQSGSIKAVNFAKVKDFVAKLLIDLDEAARHSEFSLVWFNHKTSKASGFNHLTKASERVARKGYGKGGTNTNLAIDVCHKKLVSEAKYDQIMVTITDGKSKVDPTPNAAAAMKSGITAISIGVGSSINYNELKGMASNDDLVFTADNFDDLGKLGGVLAEKTACAGL